MSQKSDPVRWQNPDMERLFRIRPGQKFCIHNTDKIGGSDFEKPNWLL